MPVWRGEPPCFRVVGGSRQLRWFGSAGRVGSRRLLTRCVLAPALLDRSGAAAGKFHARQVARTPRHPDVVGGHVAVVVAAGGIELVSDGGRCSCLLGYPVWQGGESCTCKAKFSSILPESACGSSVDCMFAISAGYSTRICSIDGR